jgi:5-methylcytosine-specific restriction endonuclease McrBC GTP-binding regulatory subunit McrB
MISININDNLTEEEDWGFYVDIENTNFNNYDNYKIMRQKYYSNKNKFNKNLECISEEYDYYLNQQKNEIDATIEPENPVNKKCSIVSVTSTTFLTLLITYFVFCVL